MPAITKLQHRRSTAAQWTSVNPVLSAAEWGYETDTGKAKIGDGVTAWATLPYAVGVTIPTNFVARTNGTVTTAATDQTVVRNIALSTVEPSGGSDGDVWMTYTP